MNNYRWENSLNCPAEFPIAHQGNVEHTIGTISSILIEGVKVLGKTKDLHSLHKKNLPFLLFFEIDRHDELDTDVPPHIVDSDPTRHVIGVCVLEPAHVALVSDIR